MSPHPLGETASAYLHHLVTVPVRVAGSDARFVLDTGIGLTLVTDAFARTIGCEPGAATFSGRRMSAQEVTVPLADGPQIAVGEYARREPAIGVLDSTTRASAASRAATRPATPTRAPSPASKGTIRLADAPHVAQRDPDVMFQRIVFDGLVGDAFLRNLVVTYDLAASRLLVA